MKPISDDLSYHKAAEEFLKDYYENNSVENISFGFAFQNKMAKECIQIGKSLSIKKPGLENAIIATYFANAGVRNISTQLHENSFDLLDTFLNESEYPVEDRAVVKNAIVTVRENRFADSKVQKIVCDAVNSSLAWPDIFENIILFKEEDERLTGIKRNELFYLLFYRELFLKRKYYTKYANDKYTIQREKNFELLEKRIDKLGNSEEINSEGLSKLPEDAVLSSKETEDLFKIAFRNYNHLISVADSKAALLIRVNSIIISLVLGLVLTKVEKNAFLLVPTILLSIFCLTTIFLSVLASRPRTNGFSRDKNSHTYQKFFFGSLDLNDRSFRHVSWENYFAQLHELFTSSKETVYIEIFKESFNVRKVLAKKFNYLSIAYWVFIIGLLFSIIFFMISMKHNSFVN